MTAPVSSHRTTRYAEKRNFLRMDLDNIVLFWTNSNQPNLEGRCRNLSGTGMLIETDDALDIGSTVEVVIPSAHTDLPKLKAFAEVVRVRPTEQSQFEIGLSIRKMF